MKSIRVIFYTLTILLLSNLVHAQDYTLAQFMNVQWANRPSFSPNSQEFAYLSNVTGVPQVWRTSANPGPSHQITFEPDGADGMWWSPTDANIMVVAASTGGNEKSQLYILDPYGSPWYRLTHDQNAMHNFGRWSSDGTRFSYASNERNKTDFDIYEGALGLPQPAVLYGGGGYLSAAGYSPDNRYLLIVCSNSNVDSDILLYDRVSGETKNLTAHEDVVKNSNPEWDGTNEGFYFICDQDREFSGLAHWSLSSNTMEWIETPEWDVEALAVSEDGTQLAWTVNVHGRSEFNYRNLNTKAKVGGYRFPSGIVGSLDFSPNGMLISATFGTASTPNDIWIYDPDYDVLHQVTHSAIGGVSPNMMREPELIEYESFDGLKIPAFWYTPAGATGKLSVVIMIHGGPESQARPDLSGLMQYLLYRGYAILEPNVRGSTGYGKNYVALDNVRKRMDSVKDLEFAAKWIEQREDVDKSKIMLFGGSYGGFMVLSGLTTYPDRWAAGVSIVGIANFVTFLENTGSYRRALREAEYGNLTNDRDFLVDVSPLTHVDKMKAPLFLIQGANDPRVPKMEADQMSEAVRNRGGVVEYLLFEDEGHGLRKIENKLEAYSRVVDFLDQHVKNR